MTDLEQRIFDRVKYRDTRKRDLLREFQIKDFPATYQSMLDRGIIHEDGPGVSHDPKRVVVGRKPDEIYPFVTKIPRAVWTDFVVRCVNAGVEPEQLVTEFLGRAIQVPTISQNPDRGY